MTVSVGFQTVDVTPPVGFSLAGFEERDHGSEGIRNRLYARAMVVGNGKSKVAVVTSDLAGIDWQLTQYVRGKVSRLADIPAEGIMITASHTHSGPTACRLSGLGRKGDPPTEAEKAYFLNLCETVAGAILAADRKAVPAKIGVGVGHLQGLGKNRRDPNGPFDDRVTVLRVEDETGRLLGVLTNFTCHPTVLEYHNYLISGDYPSFYQEALETVYPGCTPMFLQGAAGDVSTRHTRRGSTFQEAERMGKLLAGKVLEVLSTIEFSSDGTISAVIESVTLPHREFPDDASMAATLKEAEDSLHHLEESGAPANVVRTAEVTRQGAERQIRIKKILGEKDPVTEMQAVRIGPLVIAGVPAELFNSVGSEIKGSTDKAVVVLGGYCNDSVGYIVTPDVFGKQGYEAGVTLTGPTSWAVVAETGKRLVGKLV